MFDYYDIVLKTIQKNYTYTPYSVEKLKKNSINKRENPVKIFPKNTFTFFLLS